MRLVQLMGASQIRVGKGSGARYLRAMRGGRGRPRSRVRSVAQV